MAYREFATPNMSRRSLLRGGAWLTAGAALAGTPMGRVAMAREGGAAWQNVDAMVRKYVDERKVANMVATLGWGRKDPLTIARGTLALGGAVKADPDSLYRIYSMTKPITGMAAT
jgi:CubicO group peptidase (beta-lactamase class C family)